MITLLLILALGLGFAWAWRLDRKAPRCSHCGKRLAVMPMEGETWWCFECMDRMARRSAADERIDEEFEL